MEIGGNESQWNLTWKYMAVFTVGGSGSFQCLHQLIVACVFRGSFHELVYTPKYFPPTSMGIGNVQQLPQDQP